MKKLDIQDLKNILNIDIDINENTNLRDIEEWDSVAKAILSVFFTTQLSKFINIETLQQFITIGDILQYASNK